MQKRILLMHICTVSGHKEANVAIERAINMVDSDALVKSINVFDYTGPKTANLINKMYLGTIKHFPYLWGFLYDNQNIIDNTKNIKQAIYTRNYKKIHSLIEEFRPSVIVATQAFPFGLCAEYKRHFANGFKLVGVMTDHAPHAYWFEDGVDYYVVPSEEIRNNLILRGIEKDKVKVFGIPIDPKFGNKLIKQKIFSDTKIDEKLPIVLIMGGGQGLGPIKKIIKSLNNIKLDFQIILVCGTNKKLEAQIKKKVKFYKKKVIVYGFMKNIDELMSISKLIITKAGGLTTSEALAKCLPLVIIKPIPGQEKHNADYLVSKNVAIHVKRINGIKKAVTTLLKNPEQLKEMQKNTLEISKPNSSLDIAKLLLSL